MIVVKVGGSLFDHPLLGPGLLAYLESLAPAKVQLIPGGGVVADAVREFDRLHGLGEETSHWLAVRAMDVMGEMLRALISDPGITVLDCLSIARADESSPGALPHSWDVTSDSVAARAAVALGASRLVLLKSIDVPDGTPWDEAARRGWVDGLFPRVVAGGTIAVEVVNFRRVLDSLRM